MNEKNWIYITDPNHELRPGIDDYLLLPDIWVEVGPLNTGRLAHRSMRARCNPEHMPEGMDPNYLHSNPYEGSAR